MSDDAISKTRENKEEPKQGVNRRHFLKAGAVLGGAVALGEGVIRFASAMELERKDATGDMRILGCNPGTSTDGYFDNSLPPVLRIQSGDTVEIETGTHLMGGMIPGAQTEDWIRMYKDMMAKYPGTYFYPDAATGVKKQERRPNHTHLTGPIYVEGAEPGDILQIEILEIVPAAYGFNINPEPSFMKNGLLADDFKKGGVRWYRADLKNMKFGFLPGIDVPMRPFPGTLGVQLPEAGRYSNIPPGKHAGNLDCKELIAGTVLYVPTWVKGAGVVTGDSHLAQGDGEVNVSALEGAFRNITLRVTVRKDLKQKVDWPFISTPTHWITLGINTDLLEACRMAVRKAIRFLNVHYGMPDDEGYAFCSMAVDLRVTQVVDFALGIHAMIPKSSFVGKQYAAKNTLLL
jgi:acetamidase/formamidase